MKSSTAELSKEITDAKVAAQVDRPRVHRVLLLICYFYTVSVTGIALGAADPLRQLLLKNGTYSSFPYDDAVNMLTSVIGFGLSLSLLFGILIGPIMEVLGMRITAVLGILLHIGGYASLFWLNNHLTHYVAAASLGLSFQCLLNTHLNIAAVFDEIPNLVCAIIGAGPDLSLCVFPIILAISESLGVKFTVAVYLGVICGISSLFCIFLVPTTGFKSSGVRSSTTELIDDPEKQALIDQDQKPAKLLFGASIFKQVFSVEYALILVYFTFAFIRKKHTALFMRQTFRELDTSPDFVNADYYTDLYSFLVPFGLFAGIVLGGLVDVVGIVLITFVVNGLAALYLGLSTIAYMPLQIVTILCFIIIQSFVIGHKVNYIAVTFGFKNLATLQGIAATIAGSISILMDQKWADFITHYIGSYRKATLLLMYISLGLMLVPVGMYLCQRFRDRRDRQHRDSKRTWLNTITPIAPCYEKRSIALIGHT